MVDQEVVDILAEIKQRVVSTNGSDPPTQPSSDDVPSTVHSLPVTYDYASLAILARSWDRLPPLVTNRTGTAAKLDLWIKSKMKTAFRWFTWEQINFNAATHQTFKELIESLAGQQQQLASIQNELVAYEQRLQQFHQKLLNAADELHQKFADRVDDLDHRLSSVKKQNEEVIAVLSNHESHFGVLRALQASQQAEVNTKFETLEGKYASEFNQVKMDFASKANEGQERLADIVREMRERHEQILDEHRVSFKQLSLELSESQVLQDRALRELAARVSKLES